MVTSLILDKIYLDTINLWNDEENSTQKEFKIEWIKKEIESLPSKCKRIFLLSKEEGLTNLEIAEHLNVSIKSVEAHITKAFSILRKSIGKIKVDGILFLLFGNNCYLQTSKKNDSKNKNRFIS